MTDELDRLKQAFDATRTGADPAARKRAVAAALEAFDAESAAAAQGSAVADRPKASRAGWLARIFGGRVMHIPMPRLTPALMGGASLAAIVIAVLAIRDLPRGPELAEAPAPATRTEATKAARLNANEPAAAATAPAENRPSGTADDLSALRDSRAADEVAGSAEGYRHDAPATGALNSESGPAAAVDRTVRNRREGAERDAIVGGTAGPEADLRSAQRAAPAQEKFEAEVQGRMAFAPAPAPAEMQKRSEVRAAGGVAAEEPVQPVYQDQGRDNFAEIEANPMKVAAEEPVSTFSIDVDTASYSFVRRALMQGVLPQKDAVRVEELINYFPYDYVGPVDRETPFRADVQVMPTPWNAETRLMRVGIKGYALAEAEKPRANLVFLIDSSGSMNSPDKLPLLLNSFRLMLDALDPDDTVAIVTYAGAAGTVLEPTNVSESGKILAALDRLHAGGSTAGAEGIRQAYRLAEANFDAEGVNRVILATDGDFNVGITDIDELQGFVERMRGTGIFLSVLGFGQGNLNDALMQALAQNGNGQAAYIDTLSEARKTLVEEAGSTLFPIAKDVKIQVEFNPATVAEYRLIGYETRLLAREDFNNDKVDAGEIGSGHTVTALYEITPAGSPARLIDPSRYQAAMPAPAAGDVAGEYGYVKIRYKAPDGDKSTEIATPVTRANDVEIDEGRAMETRFAAAVAAFGQLLRGGRYMGDFSYDDVAALAQTAKGDDPFGYRAEFVNLVRLAKSAAALEPVKQ